MMKLTTILSVLILMTTAGCTASPTIEELETQALLSGDWSRVESRERSVARRMARQGPSCPKKHIAVCIDRFHDNICSCVQTDTARLMFSAY